MLCCSRFTFQRDVNCMHQRAVLSLSLSLCSVANQQPHRHVSLTIRRERRIKGSAEAAQAGGCEQSSQAASRQYRHGSIVATSLASSLTDVEEEPADDDAEAGYDAQHIGSTNCQNKVYIFESH
jgi:hypothetical protein